MAIQVSAQTVIFDRDHRFFFIMACLMALVLVGGFSTNIAFGRSSFGSPLIFHVHGLVFFGWVALFVTQTGLVATGSTRLHRRLGWLALAFVPAMVVMGIAMTVHAVRATGGPFFFAKNAFLIANPMGVLAFAGIVFWAIARRRRSDWHRRLMLCAMASITGPGIGRLLPLPLMMPWGWWISAVLLPCCFILAGMLADRRRMGRVHPAYVWGLALILGTQLLADAIAYSPLGYAITDAVTQGHPGALRPMQAGWPS